jgi:uncharacterized repeat protein (TIGR01451 family)
VLPLLIALLLYTGTVAPDFTTSEITADPPVPLEGDVVTLQITVRNSGDAASEFTQIDLTLPPGAFFLDTTGLPDATYDRDAARVSGGVPIAAGAAHRFSVRLLIPRDAGGTRLSPMLRASNLSVGADSYTHASVDVGTRVSSGGIDIGGYRILPAGLVTLAVLAAFPLLKLIFRGPGSSAPAFALTVAIGFWTLFGAMAVRDYQSLTTWPETTCTVRDSKLEQNTSGSTAPAGAGTTAARRTSRSDSTSYKTLLALEYRVDGRQHFSSGFDTGSRLSIGGFGGAVEEFSRWPIGQTVPCWFDPAHPEDVVVIRGFGGAYLFALFPLPLFAYGVWGLRGRAGRSGRSGR